MCDSNDLDELLLRWEKSRQQREQLSVEQLCADRPELSQELARRVEVIESMESLLGVNTASAGTNSFPNSLEASNAGRQATHPVAIPGYEIQDVLDRGGMGIVFRARQIDLPRTVAVKMLADPHLSETRLTRFRTEREAIARLEHPNIVHIYDVGEVDGRPYFSMEFVAGGNLTQFASQNRPTDKEAATFVRIIARAIHVAHKRGIVHRDLKPANVLLTKDGVPKITDFGLAKRLDQDSGHTRTGEILGTLNYMAPEQIDHTLGEVDPRTDIYALGAILFELLTGRPPFDGAPTNTLKQILHDAPPLPSKLDRNIPSDLDAICLKCLEKAPDQRYGTADELAEDLRRYLDDVPVTARRISFLGRTSKLVRRRPEVRLLIYATLVIIGLIPLTRAVLGYRQRAQLRAQAVAVAPQVKEILRRNCFQCHGQDAASTPKNLYILNHESLIDNERRIVVPGSPDDSRLIQRIADGSMPPEEFEVDLPRLCEKEIIILRQWITGGAPPFPVDDPDNPILPVVVYSALAENVKKIFHEQCYECHKYDVAKGGIKILHHRLLVEQRKVVIPGDADASELFQIIVQKGEEGRMPPPPKNRLSRKQILGIRQWIEAGAPPFTKKSGSN